jgi:uncharacterized protein with HEPN domain
VSTVQRGTGQLDACDLVQRFVSGRNRQDLETDDMLLFALVRAIEVIGEAPSRVSDDAKRTLPEVPWRQIAGMRNRLIHGYFDVNRDVVWRTATEDVPLLVRALARFRDAS